MWRIWAEGKATLQELDTHWDLGDALDANEVLDEIADAQERAEKERGR